MELERLPLGQGLIATRLYRAEDLRSILVFSPKMYPHVVHTAEDYAAETALDQVLR